MKKFKKMFAVLAASALVAAMPLTAMAAEITVQHAAKNQLYKAYKILNYTVSEDKKSYSYYLTTEQYNSGLGTALEEAGFVFTPSADKSQYVVTDAPADAQDIVKKLIGEDGDAISAIKDHKLAYAEAQGSEENEASLNFEDNTGYFFVTSTTGSLCTLASYDANEILVDKNVPPTIDKKVTGGDAKEAADANTANVGDELTYTVTLDAYAGAENYKFTDNLSKGLTLEDQSKLKVTVGDTELSQNDYVVKTWNIHPSTDNDIDIEIDFTEAYLNKIVGTDANPTVITITYNAKVNSEALQVDTVNNTSSIAYGREGGSNSDTVPTKLYGFGIEKVDKTHHDKKLAGVEFTLTNANQQYYDANSADSVWKTDETKLTTDATGVISIKGIQAGKYTLTETKTLGGYNLLPEAITIEIDKDGNVQFTGGSVGNGKTTNTNLLSIVVENSTGIELPSTGGIGTTVFAVAGLVIMAGAAAVLVIKKRS